MSESTAAAAVMTTSSSVEDDFETTMDMFGLIQAVGFDYERWCRILGLEPDSDESIDAFEYARQGFAAYWKAVGEREFLKQTRDYFDKWRDIVA